MVNGQARSYWPGGNLSGVLRKGGSRSGPRRIKFSVAGRLVYSVHDYGPLMDPGMPWCQLGTTAETPDACRKVWDQTWGLIAKRKIAPIYVGEFGTPNTATGAAGDPTDRYTHPNPVDAQGAWFTYLVDYINDLGFSWAIWPLNGRFVRTPNQTFATVETYGISQSGLRGAASAAVMRKLNVIQRRQQCRGPVAPDRSEGLVAA